LSFNLKFNAPRIVLPPSRRSLSCSSVAEVKAGPHASALHIAVAPTLASHLAAVAAAAGCAQPLSTLALAMWGASSHELKGFKTMSLLNLRQLLMGPFCSTTDGVEIVKKAYKSVEA
jgi:hypothetical protein